MKGPLSGGLNLSISDGWWPEAADGTNGWTIDGESEQLGDRERDTADANALYELLETTLVPLFHDRDDQDLPRGWIDFALQSAATVNEAFSSHRKLAEFVKWGYRPAHRGD
jgi:starch phosphorylase